MTEHDFDVKQYSSVLLFNLCLALINPGFGMVVSKVFLRSRLTYMYEYTCCVFYTLVNLSTQERVFSVKQGAYNALEASQRPIFFEIALESP